MKRKTAIKSHATYPMLFRRCLANSLPQLSRMIPIKFATSIKVHSCLNVLSAWPTSHLTSQHAANLLYMPHLSLPMRKAMKQEPINHKLTVSVCATYANCIEGPKSCKRFHTTTNLPSVELGSCSNLRSTRAQIYDKQRFH